ncbi:MAG TPA: protein kinase [Solirubrobacterales bacterium]|nr:protein kinase [Solirubrobacterales bacterium]
MAEDPFAIDSEIAGYRIDALLARGGMGVVYRATHLGLERQVALKVIARELSDREGFRERFLRESRLAARLDHPAVVPVYDSREVDGELIVAMRLVAGGDLRRLIDREGPLEPVRAIALLGQVAEALDAAHAAGIVHRDVKPHNVLVEGDRAFLSDFGLAKALEEDGAGSGASVVGTAEYMSPEQWRGGSVGPAADVYSLGCVLYEALTGIPPFARKESDTEPEMPEGLDETIERAVAKDPDDRYPSAGALIVAAREREGAGMAATRVLSADSVAAGRPTEPLRRAGPSFGRLRGRTLQWVGAGVAVVIGMVALVLLLIGGDGGVDVSGPIAIGSPPLRVAAASDAIWVTSERDGTLTRLDPESGEPVGKPIDLGIGISGVAVGEGSVWVTDPPLGELLRVDPATGAVSQRIRVGGHPGAVTYGGYRVWIADLDGKGITAVNAKGGRVFKRGIAPHEAPLRLATGGGGLWVAIADTNRIRRIDESTTVPSGATIVGANPAGVTVAGGRVWVANSGSGTVTAVDLQTRAVVGAPIEVGSQPGGIDAGSDLVWVALTGEDAVVRIALDSGQREGAPIQVGPEPGAVAVGKTAVWVADNGDGTVTRIEP